MDSRGSLWQIWDLHVHSPASYGGEYRDFISNASSSVASVLGVNDYCTIRGYEEIMKMGGVPNKVLFPVVELRMHNLLQTKHNKNGIRINFHIIFNNDKEILPTISTWLQSLKCYNEKGENIQLGVATDLSKLSFDFEKVIESLKEYNLYDSHALVWLPYDEYGGIDEIDPTTDGIFKLALINKAHILGSSTKKQIDFFKWSDQKYTEEQFAQWFDKPKPCIKGSDAHKVNYPFGHLQNQDSEPTDRYCWVNADLTFNGLKQIVVEPDRVFIGDQPDLIKRVSANKTKFIKGLVIKKTEGVSIDDTWFDNFSLSLNSGLVAIIGNKGGGKSAIADVLGLCGNTHQDPSNFSFLTSSKFRKPKPYNLSEKFEAELEWEDGTKNLLKLNQNPDKTLSERVKYIPQNFLEKLCANVESDDFEKEIKQIIYSHTPPENRFNKETLDELLEYRSSIIMSELQQLQNELSKVNNDIVKLEVKSSEDFKKSLVDKIALKKAELAAHDTNKPVKPAPTQDDATGDESTKKLTEIREKIDATEAEIASLKQKKISLALKKEELSKVSQIFTNLEIQLAKVVDINGENLSTLTKYGLDPKLIFEYKIDVTSITQVIGDTSRELSDIDIQLNPLIEGSKQAVLNDLNIGLKNGQEELAKPAKEQQKYLDALKAWEAIKKTLEGDAATEDSLRFYENQLDYLNNNLATELTDKYLARKNVVGGIFDKKNQLVNIRKELFLPVTQFISEYKELKARYDVKLDVSLELKTFSDNFFGFISQQKKGSFSGKEEGFKRLMDIIDKSDFGSKEGLIAFTEVILKNLKYDLRFGEPEAVPVEGQLKKGYEISGLYDFIFAFEYLKPQYNLKLGSKTLQELSPGERGALLLIFYLLLDNDDIPLIIDQPEENLDNESVYYILVHFIKKVKAKRQIIIVTHNPNLAVVCDADQIVHMHIEKENKNAVKYSSGAIENQLINRSVVNILEGTLPAFNNRDLKYLRN